MGVISEDAVRVVRQNINKATAVLIGPGFGLEETTGAFLSRLFEESGPVYLGDIGFIRNKATEIETQLITKPVVIDADGLKLLARIEHWFEKLPPQAVITPHPGEMSILSGLPVNEIQTNRLEIAEKYAKAWGHVLVLKGAYTVIAAPDGRIAEVPIATSALARAGTGDVLAGLIVGLRAQGAGAFEAACAGAWIHAQAGLWAADQLGTTVSVLARDVLNAVSSVISKL
jgi:NAD(P)H-hydrate epimerase